jgi:hypothetical protein
MVILFIFKSQKSLCWICQPHPFFFGRQVAKRKFAKTKDTVIGTKP